MGQSAAVFSDPTSRVTGLIGADANPYQLSLAGMVFPLWAHLVFNGVAAASLALIGHPVAAAILVSCTTGFDAIQQVLLRRWLARSAGLDPGKGLRRLGLLCMVRASIYIAPATTLVLRHQGVLELAFFGLQFASLLVVAMGASALSRAVFWGFVTPLVVAAAVIGLALFPPLVATGMTLSLASLVVLLAMISHSTTTAISTWHAAFNANVKMVDDLQAARDHALAERAEADTAREAARHADRAKSNFLATMSHEIRTPMNGVLGMAQLLKRDETEPKQIDRLDVLIDSGEYLLQILNDILDVSKIDAGKLEINPAPEDPRALLERLVSFWSARADERGVRLALEIADETPRALVFDALRVRQILFNLVGNALKFTEWGEVVVSAAVRPHEDAEHVRLHLAVRDTGPGIAEHHLPHLFDRFSQVEEAEARRFGGTGLGLAIVKQLVDLMGGQVWVESVLGEGSTFHVELPLAVADAAPAPAEHEPNEPHAIALETLRVLAVDDNAVNLLVLEQLLASLGLAVDKATGGVDALAALAETPYDLVLTDIQMPEITGIEVLQRLRATPGPNQFAPVIALTADVTSGGRQRYLELGFTEHSAKPIQLQELLSAVVRAAAAPRADDQAA
ncbi:MAG: response regulator [Phenylobacterium sp.]|uniref:ATP-binding protein n=1 Tax=Phenylobacterium sp. TaxID=1871053 RepID=UPI0025D0A1CC|nr:ATP-binding protein [Phenylobacterium sp.]MBI1200052.1 response regulator [Phenylobacterium sp.]